MLAAVRRHYGDPDSINIEDLESPSLKDNEILVKVNYTTVNRTDCANLTAKPHIMRFVLGIRRPKQPILGTDFSGEVTEIGKAVEKFKIGDRVFGFRDTGLASQAEFLALDENLAHHVPKNIDLKTAAASLEGAHYAYTFVHKTNIKSGDNILINGATGAIGSALLQFSRQYDVEITATSDTDNLKLITSLGADKVIDYSQQDFLKVKEKYNFIFDAVGKSSYLASKHLLENNGVYISSEFGPYGQHLWYSLMSKSVIFPVPFKTDLTIPYISKLLETKKFKPVIDREYRLNDAVEAYNYVISARKTGNVIVQFS